MSIENNNYIWASGFFLLNLWLKVTFRVLVFLNFNLWFKVTFRVPVFQRKSHFFLCDGVS